MDSMLTAKEHEAMIDHKGRFIYEDYMRREPFCSFCRPINAI